MQDKCCNVDKEIIDNQPIKKPRAIKVLAYVYLPAALCCVAVYALHPDIFEEKYGPSFGTTYGYTFAAVCLLYAIAIVGYWRLELWGVALYAGTLVIASLVFYLHFEIPFRIGNKLPDLAIIWVGYRYIIQKQTTTEQSKEPYSSTDAS
jgi:hypothetical protein